MLSETHGVSLVQFYNHSTINVCVCMCVYVCVCARACVRVAAEHEHAMAKFSRTSKRRDSEKVGHLE